MVDGIDDLMEKVLLDKYMLAYMSGKSNRLVPVLIPNDTIEGINKLVSEREAAGVSPDNKYLFAHTEGSTTHVPGWPCIKQVCEKEQLTDPSKINTTRFRHRASTYYALLDTTKEQRDVFYQHMEHEKGINENVYQCPLAIKEVSSVGPYLEGIDGSRPRKS